MSTSQTTSSTSSPSGRFDVLMKLIETGMDRSRQELNTTELVKVSYGNDATMLGGTDIVAGTMDDMLDKVHQQVLKHDLPKYLEEHSIRQMLQRVESIVETLDREEAAQAQAERDDQESAIRAMDASLLPRGITLQDAITFHQYQQAMAQKEQMAKALEALQEDIAALEQNQAEILSKVEAQQQTLDQTAQELGRSADICSMVASSS